MGDGGHKVVGADATLRPHVCRSRRIQCGGRWSWEFCRSAGAFGWRGRSGTVGERGRCPLSSRKVSRGLQTGGLRSSTASLGGYPSLSQQGWILSFYRKPSPHQSNSAALSGLCCLGSTGSMDSTFPSKDLPLEDVRTTYGNRGSSQLLGPADQKE